MYIILYYFSEELEGSKGDREEDRERNIDGKETHWLVALCMCPDRGWQLITTQIYDFGEESNPQPFTVQAVTPTTKSARV